MDTLIKNGDFYLDSTGKPVTITDEDELLQRALIILSTKKGDFSFDRELGCKLYTLGRFGENRLDDAAFEAACDALIGIKGLCVKSAKVTPSGNDYTVELTLYMESIKRLVKIKI